MRWLLILFCGWFAASPCDAATITEDFASDPLTRGWATFGDASLFQWNSDNEYLDVTWDSSKSNSYFYKPLNNILAKDDDFSLEFDVSLDDITPGTTPGKPYTFQIAIALLSFADATRSNLFGGSGINSSNGPRSHVEFNYFPAAGVITPTFSCIAVASNNAGGQFRFAHDFPLEMDPGAWFHIVLAYVASNQTLTMTKTRNGEPYGDTNSITLNAPFTDFRLDTLAIANYNDAGQNPPQFSGSVLAHGHVDNFALTLPDHPVVNQQFALSGNAVLINFQSRSNWLYTLTRSTDLASWASLAVTTNGNDSLVELRDTTPPTTKAYYRVKAERP